VAVRIDWEWVVFFVLAGATLWSGYRVATVTAVTHAALWLAAVLVGVAALFFMLQADFLAVVQLLVYAGGVMTVVIFAIMLSDMKGISGGEPGGVWSRLNSPDYGLLPLSLAVLVFVVLMVAYVGVPWPSAPRPAPADTAALLGRGLFTVYAVPFEVASVLLLAALVGAIILTRREESD
jgi:NADH-quinone oxidoreductase subunit J